MAAIDLTTINLVREWIPAPATTPSPGTLAQQNSVLQAAITAISADFLKRMGYGPQNGQAPTQSPFNQPVQYSEVYDGSGTSRLFLRNRPIISVQSLTIFGLAVQQSSGPGASGFAIDGSGKSISLVSVAPGFPLSPVFPLGAIAKFPRGTQNIAITYTAGYSSVSVPAELQTIPASPGPYTVTPNQNWLADGGVKYFSTGNPFTAVQIAPQQGQYYLNNGVYLFNAADAGQQIQLAYTAAGTPADLELAARRTVFLQYQRRGWEGLASLAKPDSGQTSYTRWELDPEAAEVVANYARTAIV